MARSQKEAVAGLNAGLFYMQLKIFNNNPSRKHAATLQAVGGYANTAVTVIQGLVLVPMFLHYIGAHTYGLWLASGGILAWLSFIDLGISGMFVQRIARAYGQADFSQVGAYFVNGVIITFSMALVFIALGLVVSLWLPKIPGAGEKGILLQQCFQLAIFAAGLDIVNETLRAFAQALLRPVFAIISLIACRILGIVAIMILLFNDYNLWSLPIGYLITAIAVFMLNLINSARLFKHFGAKFSINKEVLGEYIRISPALFVGRIGNAMVQQVDPLLITLMLRPEMSTMYVITKRAADIISQLLHVIIASSFPSFSHLAGKGDSARTTQISRYIITMLLVFGLVGLSSYVAMNQSFVSLWVGEEFFLGTHVVLFIAVATLVMVLRNTLSRILMGLGDILVPSLLFLPEACLRILLIAALLKTLGVVGVPIALLVSCCVFLFILAMRAAKVLPSIIDGSSLKRTLLLSLIAFSAAYVLAQSISSADNWWLFSLQLILVSVAYVTGALYLSPSLYRATVQALLRG